METLFEFSFSLVVLDDEGPSLPHFEFIFNLNEVITININIDQRCFDMCCF